METLPLHINPSVLFFTRRGLFTHGDPAFPFVFTKKPFFSGRKCFPSSFTRADDQALVCLPCFFFFLLRTGDEEGLLLATSLFFINPLSPFFFFSACVPCVQVPFSPQFALQKFGRDARLSFPLGAPRKPFETRPRNTFPPPSPAGFVLFPPPPPPFFLEEKQCSPSKPQRHKEARPILSFSQFSQNPEASNPSPSPFLFPPPPPFDFRQEHLANCFSSTKFVRRHVSTSLPLIPNCVVRREHDPSPSSLFFSFPLLGTLHIRSPSVSRP